MAPRRRLILFAALALTLVAVFTVDHDELPAPARREPSRAAPAAATPAAVAGNRADLNRRQYATARGDIFPPHSWLPPLVAGNVEEAPAGPPALPFTYLGKIHEGRETVVFLLFQENTLAVRRGDVVDGAYRVEQITPQSMVLLYLPLNEKQSLDFVSAH